MKKLFVIILILFSFATSFGQQVYPIYSGNKFTIYVSKGAREDSVGYVVCSIDTLNNPLTSWQGAITFRPQDKLFYYSDGHAWHLMSGSSFDTTSLSNRINLKVNISDTAS